MDCSTPGLLVPHYLPESAQVCVHWTGDAIQPFHLLSPSSPFAFNLSQHQGLFQWEAQSCLTLCNPMDCNLPGSSAHEILQARILEWVVIPFSRRIFQTLGHQGCSMDLHENQKIRWWQRYLEVKRGEGRRLCLCIIWPRNVTWDLPWGYLVSPRSMTRI